MSSLQNLLLNYIALTLISALLAWVTHLSARTLVSRYAFYFWLSTLFGFVCQSFAGYSPFYACLAVLSSIPSSLIISRLLSVVFDVRIKSSSYAILAVSCVIAFGFLYSLEAPFWMCSSPLVILVAGPITLLIIKSFSIPRRLTFAEIVFLLALFCISSHFYDYPFLRLDSEYELLGFTIAFWNGFFCAVTLPALVIDQHNKSYMVSLQQKVDLASADLLKINQDLKVSEREKTALLQIVSHDMANALTVGDYSAQKLLRRFSGPRNVENSAEDFEQINSHVKRINFALGTLVGLIANIRVLQSKSGSDAKLVLSSISIKAALEEAILLTSSSAEAKAVAIRLSNISDKDLILGNQIFVVNCILSNLISNSIKFCSPGQEIHISGQPNTESQTYRLMVSDNGVGMDQSTIQRLLADEPVASRSGTWGEKGTGFGFQNLKSICKILNAKISIDSKVDPSNPSNSGTTVTIDFKLH